MALCIPVFVDCGYWTTKRKMRYKQSRLSVTVYSTRPTRPCYTQSRSSVNRVYDSKARHYAEDNNRTESNCTHCYIWSRSKL